MSKAPPPPSPPPSYRSKKETEETSRKADEEWEGGGIAEIQVEERKLEGDVMKNGDEGALGEALVSTGAGFVDVDYDKEKGEIVEDEGLNDDGDGDFGKQKKLDSNVESGEIEIDRHDNTNMKIFSTVGLSNSLWLFQWLFPMSSFALFKIISFQ